MKQTRAVGHHCGNTKAHSLHSWRVPNPGKKSWILYKCGGTITPENVKDHVVTYRKAESMQYTVMDEWISKDRLLEIIQGIRGTAN